MNKIILADPYAVFRTGVAHVLGLEEDMRIIAQCASIDCMHHAIARFTGSVVLFASSFQLDLIRLRMLLEATGSRGIVIVESDESFESYLHMGFCGAVLRSVEEAALIECVRRIAAGDIWQPAQLMQSESHLEMVGTRSRIFNSQNLPFRELDCLRRDRPIRLHLGVAPS